MQITTDLLLDAIFVLINDNSERYQNAVKELISLRDEQNVGIESSESELADFYVRILNSIIVGNIDRRDPDALRNILLKFKSDKSYADHRGIVEDLKEAFMSHETISADKLGGMVQAIQNALLWHRANKAWRKASGRFSRAASSANAEVQMMEMEDIKKELDNISSMFAEANDNAPAAEAFDTVNFHQRDTIRAGLKKNTARNISGIIKTGLQGLNRALGKAGGFVGGESIVFNALPHMYKSGILVSTALWSVIYNQIEAEPGTKPLIYLVSLENEAFQNMMNVFRKVYYNETGMPADSMSDQDVEDWIVTYFEKFQTTLIIERHLPHKFGFKEFVSRISYFRTLGYTPKVAVIDYANLMRKDGDSQASKGSRDLAVRELFSRLCNFTKNEGITFVTAHPLIRRASEIAANNTNAVKRFTPDLLAEGMDVEREVDVSIYLHKEKNHIGDEYLTFRLNKHRYVDDTPEAHKYFAYKFHDIGGIIDDLGKVPGFVTDIYAADFDSDNANDNSQSGLGMASGIF